MIVNIWEFLDLIQEKITALNPWFPIYAGKPSDELDWKACYFYQVSQWPKIADDSKWVHKKEALMEFVVISWQKNTPDVELYEMLSSIVNKILLEEWDSWTLTGGFKIGSIREGSQSGVFHDVKERPYIIAQFFFIYQSRYDTLPRL